MINPKAWLEACQDAIKDLESTSEIRPLNQEELMEMAHYKKLADAARIACDKKGIK